jgi:hypothetical protein
MSFEQPTTITFEFNNDSVEYTVQNDVNIGWIINCNYPIFTNKFNGVCFNNPIGTFMNQVNYGDTEYDFIINMFESFRSFRR